MAKTKQTARKVDQPVRQAGMEPAVLAPLAPQQEGVPHKEEGAQAGAEEVEVVQPEEQVTTEQDPADPTGQPGISTAPTPGTIGLVEEQSKIKDLKLGIVGFSDQDVDSVLESISDMSGKYIDTVDRLQVEVSKEEEEITRKRFTESKKASQEQKALDEYYDVTKDLCQSQALYMARLEKLSKVLDNPDRLLAIINHVQLPAVQVMVTTKEQDKRQAGLSSGRLECGPTDRCKNDGQLAVLCSL